MRFRNFINRRAAQVLSSSAAPQSQANPAAGGFTGGFIASAIRNAQQAPQNNALSSIRMNGAIPMPASQAPTEPMSGNFISNAVRNITMQNNQMQPNAISPTALSNQGTINGVFGNAVANTFTRSVGTPLNQMTSQGYVPPMDPTNPGAQNDVNAVMAQADQFTQAIPPPYGVQQPITPTYDLNTQ